MDTLSKSERSERMRRIRGRDTKPEMIVRRLIHGMGYRYRLHQGGLPGKPDLVFPGRKKAIFVHGCFWHRHPDPNCRLARMPKTQLDFWGPKLATNRERDERNISRFEGLGWRVLQVWECQIKNREELAARIVEFLQC
jgi:DNA mismatch endonuclease (patch repair protein)